VVNATLYSNIGIEGVFDMTSSNADSDREKAYKYNIAGYIVKPPSQDQVQKAVQMINDYCKNVTLPIT